MLLWGVLYVVKVMHSPTQFTFGDELQHWLTAQNLLTAQHLFSQNSILPISPYYPGLEIVTSALVNLTGMSIYSAGILIIAAARLVLVLTLYVIYEIISHSPRVAGLGTLLYIANPMFLFFDAQFAYEFWRCLLRLSPCCCWSCAKLHPANGLFLSNGWCCLPFSA